MLGFKQGIFLNGDALKEFLKENSIRESDFAKKTGVAHSTVNRILNGKRNPGSKFISGVLEAYPQLTFNEVFIFKTNLPKGKITA